MTKETYYFSHDYHARNDRKIAALVKDYKSSGYGIFWATCELMHEEGGLLEFDDITIHTLARDLNEFDSLIAEVLDKCVTKYRLFTKQIEPTLEANEATLQANEAPVEAKILLQSGRIKRNLDDRIEKQKNKAEIGRLGGIKSGESRKKKEIIEAERTNGSTKRTEVEQNEQKERKGKESNSTINVTPELIVTTVGSEKVKVAANEAWADKLWINNTCKAHQIAENDLQLWMYQYNASVSNDPINGFNAAKYKKMFSGWLNTQFSKGYKLPIKPTTGREQFTTI